MKREIIKFDESRHDGRGPRASARHEGQSVSSAVWRSYRASIIAMAWGTAFLPACPRNVIAFTPREAAEYDKEAVKIN
jgi:hypothetical protein